MEPPPPPPPETPLPPLETQTQTQTQTQQPRSFEGFLGKKSPKKGAGHQKRWCVRPRCGDDRMQARLSPRAARVQVRAAVRGAHALVLQAQGRAVHVR